jgi:prophage maintenance system killer protein
MKKDYCVRKAFENLGRARYQNQNNKPSLKDMLNRIEQQGKQNRQKREEYEKTVDYSQYLIKKHLFEGIKYLNS